MSDWITHDGKGCPVGDNVQVLVITRRGLHVNHAGEFGWYWKWDKWDMGGFDIIAYQVIKPYKPE